MLINLLYTIMMATVLFESLKVNLQEFHNEKYDYNNDEITPVRESNNRYYQLNIV